MAIVRHLGRLLPQWREMRTASAQWRRWLLRRLLFPILRIRFVVTARSGARHALGDDPVDDAVFKHLHGSGSGLYFPAVGNGEPAGIILDVGAHHGIYAIEALRRYPRCTVVAVEPDPEACRAIAANAALNGVTDRIEIVAAGLAPAEGAGWLLFDRQGSWATRTAVEPPAAAAGARAELRTLHSILRGRRPAVVKCNAEGAEFALVPQLVALGCQPDVIVLMVHPEAGAPAALVSLLAGAGYDVRDADSPPLGHRFHCFKRA